MFDWDRFKQGKIKVILRTEQLAKDFYKECKKRGIDWECSDYAIWKDEGIEYKYHVPSESLTWNWIKDNGQESVEWKGVNCMKELTFKEVIANIKEGEVWESLNPINGVFVSKDVNGISIRDKKGNSLVWFSDLWIFKPKRKEYTFEEAFKAYKEGKEIESIQSYCKYEDGKFKLNNQFSEWLPLRSMPIEEIEGKWYIND